MKSTNVVVSCEHAGNQIPLAFQHLFKGAEEVLASHRGWDPRSKEIGLIMAKTLEATLFMTEISRLLVECNRSSDHPSLFSEFTKTLPTKVREEILEKYYHGYRDQVIRQIEHCAKRSEVVHLSVHTFTPIRMGEKRSTDIGLLFDEAREREVNLCTMWKKNLETELPDFRIDFNRPYLGSDDGFTTYLRKHFPEDRYLGIEIEVNQRFHRHDQIEKISAALVKSFKKTRIN